MKQVFLSYRYDDKQAKAIVQFLREHLPAIGAEPIDIYMNETLTTGEDWGISLTEAINRCAVVVCIAGNAQSNAMFELGYALAKNKQIVLVGDSQSIPFDLRQMIYIPKESHPFDILVQVQKCLSAYEERRPYLGLNPLTPKPSLNTLSERPDLIDSLEGPEFEEIVKEWFLAKGYKVNDTDVARDTGFDFIVHPFRGTHAAVEVKKYRSTSRVPVAVVRQLLGAMVGERLSAGIVVSSAPYTDSAIFFAREIEPPVLLWTLADLVKMNEMPNKGVELMGDPRSESPNPHP